MVELRVESVACVAFAATVARCTSEAENKQDIARNRPRVKK